jgi:hypothetical protein
MATAPKTPTCATLFTIVLLFGVVVVEIGSLIVCCWLVEFDKKD